MLNNTFGRKNTSISEEEWRDINQDIIENGIQHFVFGNTTVVSQQANKPKVRFPSDIVCEGLMQAVVDATEKLEKYLEIEKFDELKANEEDEEAKKIKLPKG